MDTRPVARIARWPRSENDVKLKRQMKKYERPLRSSKKGEVKTTKAKRGVLVSISREVLDSGEYWIHGHDLTPDEVFGAIWKSDFGEDLKIEGETFKSFKIKNVVTSSIEEWGRWGFCDECMGDDYRYCFHNATKGQRGAFAYTIVVIEKIGERLS